MTDNRLLYSAGEMATMCGVHPKTWKRWVDKGDAPQPVYVNNDPKWLCDEVRDWMRSLKKIRQQKVRRVLS